MQIGGRRGNSLVVGLPLIAGAVHRLDSIKTRIKRPELVAYPADVAVDGVALDQTLPRHVTQCVIGADVARMSSEGFNDPELGKSQIDGLTFPVNQHTFLVDLQ